MKVSNQIKWMLVEATVTTVIGLINTRVGIALTYSLVLYHWRFDKPSHPQQERPAQQIIVKQPTQKRFEICPLLEAMYLNKQ